MIINDTCNSFADPDANHCDESCGGVITSTHVASQVACRAQCILPDFDGLFLSSALFYSHSTLD